MNRTAKLLAIGLDACDLGFIRRREAQLPTLRKLLDTTLLFEPAAPKALNGSVWPSFYTGSHPGHHGIYQHLAWDAHKMGLRFIGPELYHRRPFWADLEDRGRKVVVLDVPVTLPIFLKRGVEITDWGTHTQTWPVASNRPEVQKFLRKFGRSPIGREAPIEKTRGQIDAIHKRLIASIDRKRDLMLALIKEFDWDVLIAVFGELHRGGHIFYGETDALPSGSPDAPLLEIYRGADRALASILESVDLQRTTVIIFAAHGMSLDCGQGHLVRPLMERLNQQFLKRHLGISAAQSTGGFVRWLRGSVPSGLQSVIADAAPDRIRHWVVEREVIGGIDWSRTPAFCLRSDVRPDLRLNLVGRESKGMLKPGSETCRAYLDFLHRTLLELKDADTGDQLVDEVVDVHALFPGEHSHALPDFGIEFRPAPPALRAFAPEIGNLEAKPSTARGGDHTDVGFAAVWPSQPIQVRLASNSLPSVETTWDLSNLFMRLDELGAE